MKLRVGHGSGLISPVYIGQAIGAGGTDEPATLLRTYRGLAADLYQDTAATDPVDTNGDFVQAWETINGGDLVTEGTYTPTWNEGELAVAFTGDFLTGDMTGLPSGSASCSYGLWLNLNSIPWIYYIPYHFGDVGSEQCGIYIDSAGQVLMVGASAFIVTSTTTLSTNTWYHIVCTWDGTTGRIYIDGVEDASNTGSHVAGTTNYVIGSFGNTEFALDGMLDGIEHYSGVLTAGEVSTLFGLGR